MKLYDLHLVQPDGSSGIIYHFSTTNAGIMFLNAFRDKCIRKFGKNLLLDNVQEVQPSKYEPKFFLDLEGTDHTWEMEFIKELGYLNPSHSVLENYEFCPENLKLFFEEN